MLSHFDNDRRAKIRRTQSSTSIRDRRNFPPISAPFDLEAGKVQALIAAHRAMDRSRGSASASSDLHRSDSSTSKVSTGAPNTKRNHREVGSGDIYRSKSVRQTAAASVPSQLSSLNTEKSSRADILSYTHIPLSEFGSDYDGEPSSYRRLRKAKSALNPSRG